MLPISLGSTVGWAQRGEHARLSEGIVPNPPSLREFLFIIMVAPKDRSEDQDPTMLYKHRVKTTPYQKSCNLNRKDS